MSFPVLDYLESGVPFHRNRPSVSTAWTAASGLTPAVWDRSAWAALTGLDLRPPNHHPQRDIWSSGDQQLHRVCDAAMPVVASDLPTRPKRLVGAEECAGLFLSKHACRNKNFPGERVRKYFGDFTICNPQKTIHKRLPRSTKCSPCCFLICCYLCEVKSPKSTFY